MRVNEEDPIARRKQLGRLLRRAREEVRPKLTQEAVAKVLGCGQAKITKIETKLVGINPLDLDKLIQLYQVSAERAAELRKLAELDRQNGPPRTKHVPTPEAFEQLSDVETEASEIRCWHSERLPGPLQSQLYMLKQYEPLNCDPTHVLRVREARSKVFTVPNPPRYRAIISESSLHRLPGGNTAPMVVDQSEHLLGLIGSYERLELRILTFDADIPWVDSDFEHLMFDGPTRSEFVYIEYPGGSRIYKSPLELAECREEWARLDKAALNVDESREFLIGLTRRGELPAHRDADRINSR
jgi:transcriptional regulator with XRE-family HTH domain